MQRIRNHLVLKLFIGLAACNGLPRALAEDAAANNAQVTPVPAATPQEAPPTGVRMCPCPPTPKHVLNGHAFQPSYMIPAPFADSQATVGLALSYGSFDEPGLLGIAFPLKLGAFEPHVWGQVRVLEGLAINFGMRGNLIVGMNDSAALNYGASTSYAFELGALYELIRADSDVFTLALDVSRPHTLAASPVDIAQRGFSALVGSGDPQFFAQGITTRWIPNLRYAHGFTSSFGLLSYVGVQVDQADSNVSESTTSALMNIGIGGSFDFKPVIDIPIGFTADYRRAQAITSGETTSNSYTVGIFETSGPEFNFGLEAGTLRSQASHSTLVALTAKVYYN